MNFNLKFDGPEQLCDTCRSGKRVSDGTNTYRTCSAFMKEDFDPNKVRVTKCESYIARNHMSLMEMKATAWIIDVNKKGSIGFIKPRDRSKRDEDEIDEVIYPE